MADPELGNRSSEQGQYERGADFEGINRSTLPAAGPILEVDVKSDGANLQLSRRNGRAARSLELRHSESDILSAQLLDDPEMTAFEVPNVGKVEASPSRISKALSRNANREQLIWFGIDSANKSAVIGDRIIVRRDTLESEYICRSCKGKGHTDEECGHCGGKQQRNGEHCKSCTCLGYEAETPHPSGFARCEDCRGSGWKNGIVVPETAQGKPVTGVVVSLGPETKLLKLGDRVLHSKFAGHTLDMKQETYTFMRESEVISLLRDTV
jgi:co-chaperonin GroES (HSP10)